MPAPTAQLKKQADDAPPRDAVPAPAVQDSGDHSGDHSEDVVLENPETDLSDANAAVAGVPTAAGQMDIDEEERPRFAPARDPVRATTPPHPSPEENLPPFLL